MIRLSADTSPIARSAAATPSRGRLPEKSPNSEAGLRVAPEPIGGGPAGARPPVLFPLPSPSRRRFRRLISELSQNRAEPAIVLTPREPSCPKGYCRTLILAETMHTSGIDLPHFPQHLVRVDPTSFFAACLSAARVVWRAAVIRSSLSWSWPPRVIHEHGARPLRGLPPPLPCPAPRWEGRSSPPGIPEVR